MAFIRPVSYRYPHGLSFCLWQGNSQGPLSFKYWPDWDKYCHVLAILYCPYYGPEGFPAWPLRPSAAPVLGPLAPGLEHIRGCFAGPAGAGLGPCSERSSRVLTMVPVIFELALLRPLFSCPPCFSLRHGLFSMRFKTYLKCSYYVLKMFLLCT